MRVLIVSDYYPPFIGGAHRQTALIARSLAERGHAVHVAAPWYSGAVDELDATGVRVHRVRQLRTLVPRLCRPGQRHQPNFPDPVTALALRRIIRRSRPDVVHAFGGMAFSAALALRGSSTPMVLVARDYGYVCPTRTLVREGSICSGPGLQKCLTCANAYYGPAKGVAATVGLRVGRPILRRRADVVASVSSYVSDVMAKGFVGPRAAVATAVLPSFRESDDVVAPTDSAIARRLDAIGEPFILFVGALRLEKGIAELLEAYARIEGAPPLVLVGTRERDTPRQLPAGVHIVEDASFADVVGAWDRSLFGVLPSRMAEPLGSVVYEGMSRGRAVVGTYPGGHTDMIVDGESGLLVPAGDAAALEGAMRRLLDDPALRERLGSTARVQAEAFTAARVIPALESLFERVVAGRGGVLP